MKEIIKEHPILSGTIAICILFIAFIVVDGAFSKSKSFEVTVIDKHYTAEKNTSGTGTVISTTGKVGFVTTNEHNPEIFLLMVINRKGEIQTVNTTPEIYYTIKKGEKLKCVHSLGYFTNSIWNKKAIKL